MSDNGAKLGFLTALITSISFLMSACHELGFFRVIGYEYIHFVSVSDYLNVVVSWLPIVSLSVLAGMFFELITSRIEGWQTEDEIVAGSPTPSFTRKFRNSAQVVNLVVIPFVLLLGFFITFEGEWFILTIPVAVMWMIVSGWISIHPKSPFYEDKRRRYAFMFLPAFLVGAFFHGMDQGYEVRSDSVDNYIVNGKYVSVVRSMERGILYRDTKEARLVFRGWQDIKQVERNYEAVRMETKACLWFGFLCIGDQLIGEKQDKGGEQ